MWVQKYSDGREKTDFLMNDIKIIRHQCAKIYRYTDHVSLKNLTQNES